ncbi:MAG: helicase C-terminal domain-containing protein [Nanoarchaeota archaeon]|nr:helicase C-terminal domain-containing protein [Nanoarchaeota archaeon]
MWNLYQREKFLEPLKFSNGKTQEDIVREVLEAIKEGNKIIFIHGVCGTGKSAIALNIARNLGKSSVIVPGKTLQNQYKRDYENEKYLLKNDGSKLKISVITGRNNHKCKFLEDNKNSIPVIKKEIDSKLHDIFSGKREEIEETIAGDISADNSNLPCKIELKEKNWKKIMQYIKQNKKNNSGNFLEMKDVRRVPVASACPYWSPVLPEKYELKDFGENKKRKFKGIGGDFVFHQGKPGCSFYEQFHSYIDADVIVFNSWKYKFESIIGRKPLTEAEIIDEGDEFLDSFANQRSLNIDRVQNSLLGISEGEDNIMRFKNEILETIKNLKKDERIQESASSGEIIPLKETGVYDLLTRVADNTEFLDWIDEESYLFQVKETSRMFDEFYNETYVTFSKQDNNLVASLVTTNLEKRFEELVSKNKIIIFMSGTLHSEKVLEDIFGLKDFKKIDAEKEQQGSINVLRTGYERDYKYANFSNGRFSREDYLDSLNRCLEIAEKPVLVHVNAFSDLPSEEEIKKFKLKNLISSEKLKELQFGDKENSAIKEFKDGRIKVLFTTKCARGIDFPGDECKSILFTKYPNPNVQDAFWKILMKTKPQQYWDFYKDKARRELLQKVYRGLRFKEDKVNLLSPDSRVLDFFENDRNL